MNAGPHPCSKHRFSSNASDFARCWRCRFRFAPWRLVYILRGQIVPVPESIRDLDLRSRNKRFVVLPGYVQSVNDGQIHWIDASRLMELYGVPSFQCVVVDRRRPEHAHGELHWAVRDLIKLSPRTYRRDYRLPPAAQVRLHSP